MRGTSAVPAVGLLTALLALAPTAIPPADAAEGADPEPAAEATPAAATLVADPATDLVDGQVIWFEGTGHPPDTEVQVLQCPASATVLGECGWAGTGRTDTAGDLVAWMAAKTTLGRFDLAPGTHDCRAAPCKAVVFAGPLGPPDQDISGDASTPLAFDPQGPAELTPTLTVTPDSGLTEGQTVTVTGTGFRPGLRHLVTQCLAGFAQGNGCRYESQGARYLVASSAPSLDDPQPDPAAEFGTFAVDVVVERSLRTFDAGTVDCTRSPCELVATPYDTAPWATESAAAPIAFTGEAVTAGPVAARPGFTG